MVVDVDVVVSLEGRVEDVGLVVLVVLEGRGVDVDVDVAGDSAVTVSMSEGLVGTEGWDIAFCPVICEPSSNPALMWCVKLLLIAGRVATVDGTPQIVDRR